MHQGHRSDHLIDWVYDGTSTKQFVSQCSICRRTSKVEIQHDQIWKQVTFNDQFEPSVVAAPERPGIKFTQNDGGDVEAA